MADARHLFEWRNDPLTRAMSRCGDPVSWAEHCIWLGRTIEDPRRRLLVIEVDGERAAVARFDDDGVEVEFSLTIAPEWRHRGVSLPIAQLAIAQVPTCHGFIKPENIACQRLMSAIGMYLAEDGEMQHWRYRADMSAAA